MPRRQLRGLLKIRAYPSVFFIRVVCVCVCVFFFFFFFYGGFRYSLDDLASMVLPFRATCRDRPSSSVVGFGLTVRV